MKTLATRKPAADSRISTLAKMAAALDMRLLKLGKATCAFVSDKESQIFVYQIDARYPLGRSWTPGRCIATLNRKDSDDATFEALGSMMIQD